MLQYGDGAQAKDSGRSWPGGAREVGAWSPAFFKEEALRDKR
jgi:hypothetical protein